jgi:hypothetical protein
MKNINTNIVSTLNTNSNEKENIMNNTNSINLKDLKKGEYFTLKEIAEPNENQVYVRGDYDRESKTYSCYKFSDTNSERFIKGNKKVFIDFVF